MKRWIGRWMIGTAFIHTLFAIVVFWDTWLIIITNGVFNTVQEDPVIAATVFFSLWGFVYLAFGIVIDALERNEQVSIPKSLGWGLLFNGLIGIVLTPASGFWLLFPPAIAVLKTKKNPNQ